ncbi:hypothetical protein NC797_18005, partial [Aquibacillus sp. 3ASR75-11]
ANITFGTRGLAWSISSATKSGDYPRSPHFKQPARVVSGGSSSRLSMLIVRSRLILLVLDFFFFCSEQQKFDTVIYKNKEVELYGSGFWFLCILCPFYF